MDKVFQHFLTYYNLPIIHEYEKALIEKGWYVYKDYQPEEVADSLYEYAYTDDPPLRKICILLGKQFEILDDVSWLAQFVTHGIGYRAINEAFMEMIGIARISKQKFNNLYRVCANMTTRHVYAFDTIERIYMLNNGKAYTSNTLSRPFKVGLNMKATCSDFNLPSSIQEYGKLLHDLESMIHIRSIDSKEPAITIEFDSPVYNLLDDKLLATYTLLTEDVTTDQDKAIQYIIKWKIGKITQKMFDDKLYIIHKALYSDIACEWFHNLCSVFDSIMGNRSY